MPTRENPRDRYRTQVHSEILDVAWDQLSRLPPRDLSIKAVATVMRLTPPALYRYIGSRDELLVELTARVDDELAAVVEMAIDADDEHLIGVAVAIRRWAVAHPYHYLLRFAAPDQAPSPEGVDAEARALQIIGNHFSDAAGRPRPRPARDGSPTTALTPHERAVSFWTRVHGVLALELTGHLHHLGVDPETHLTSEVAGPAGLAAAHPGKTQRVTA